MRFIVLRSSDQNGRNQPHPAAAKVREFDEAHYAEGVWTVEINSLEELLALGRIVVMPNDVAYRFAWPLPAEVAKLPAIEIYDSLRE